MGNGGSETNLTAEARRLVRGAHGFSWFFGGSAIVLFCVSFQMMHLARTHGVAAGGPIAALGIGVICSWFFVLMPQGWSGLRDLERELLLHDSAGRFTSSEIIDLRGRLRRRATLASAWLGITIVVTTLWLLPVWRAIKATDSGVELVVFDARAIAVFAVRLLIVYGVMMAIFRALSWAAGLRVAWNGLIVSPSWLRGNPLEIERRIWPRDGSRWRLQFQAEPSRRQLQDARAGGPEQNGPSQVAAAGSAFPGFIDTSGTDAGAAIGDSPRVPGYRPGRWFVPSVAVALLAGGGAAAGLWVTTTAAIAIVAGVCALAALRTRQ